MLRLCRNKKAQSTAEYAILIGLVVAVAIGIQTYVKRGLQARVHDETQAFTTTIGGDGNWDAIAPDTTGTAVVAQFEPEGVSSQSTQKVIEDIQDSAMPEGGKVQREYKRTTSQGAGDYQKYDYTP